LFPTLRSVIDSIKTVQKNRPHMMTFEEYAQQAAYIHGFGEKPKFILSPPLGMDWSDPKQRASAFPLEGPKLSFSLPGSKREPLGMRGRYQPI